MTPERLELFPATPQRRPVVYVLAGFCLMGFLSIPMQMIEHYFAPEPEPKPVMRRAEPSPAPIWSKKCEAMGKGFIAHQADGGRWIVICTNGGVRT